MKKKTTSPRREIVRLHNGNGKLDVRDLTPDLSEHRPRLNKQNVKNIREVLQVSQTVLARLLGVSPAVVKAWEQGYSKPSGAASRLLQIAAHKPKEFVTLITECETRSSRRR